VAGNPLGIAEAEFSSVLAQYTVASSLTIASGAYSYGAAGQQATIDRSDIPGALTIQVEQAIAGTGDNPPDSGRIRITAEDDGRLTITIEDGQLSLALDADGDGTVDDTIGPVDWADLID
jgi:histone H3/H4